MSDKRFPRHVAIILDGNGRWAQQRGRERTYGHQIGAANVKNIVRAAGHMGIRCLTIYAFSTENWKRPAFEVNFLMHLFKNYLIGQLRELITDNVQVHIIGDTMELPSSLQEEIKVCEKDTANNDGLILNVAINYGGRMELVNAVRDISQKLQKAGWKQILLQKKPSRTTSILRHHQMWICLYVRAVNRGYRISFYGRFRIANCISHLFYGLIFQVKSWKRLFSGSQEEIVVLAV